MAYDSVYMGVDAGTTKLKLMLYDNSLREIGSASRDTVIYMPENGASEIDMDELWQSLCDAAQELCRAYPDAMAALRCIGVTGQGDGLWPLDENGRPACRAILWNDTRGKDAHVDDIPGLHELLSRECMNTVFAGSSTSSSRFVTFPVPRTITPFV